MSRFSLPVMVVTNKRKAHLGPLAGVVPGPLVPVKRGAFVRSVVSHFIGYKDGGFCISMGCGTSIVGRCFSALESSSCQVGCFRRGIPLKATNDLALVESGVRAAFFISGYSVVVGRSCDRVLGCRGRGGGRLAIITTLGGCPVTCNILCAGRGNLLSSVMRGPSLAFGVGAKLCVLRPGLLSRVPRKRFCRVASLVSGLEGRGEEVKIFPIDRGS